MKRLGFIGDSIRLDVSHKYKSYCRLCIYSIFYLVLLTSLKACRPVSSHSFLGNSSNLKMNTVALDSHQEYFTMRKIRKLAINTATTDVGDDNNAYGQEIMAGNFCEGIPAEGGGFLWMWWTGEVPGTAPTQNEHSWILESYFERGFFRGRRMNLPYVLDDYEDYA